MWTVEEIKSLVEIESLVKTPFDFIQEGQADEFTVQRENGQVDGIFKVKALSVIPFLDTGKIDLLRDLWPSLSKKTKDFGFFGAIAIISECGDKKLKNMAKAASQIYEKWHKKTAVSPMRLSRSLERARLNCWLLDKRLAENYCQNQVPDNLNERINALINRLILAFGLASPFYNLEVLVGDSSWLGSSRESSASDEGILDLVAFLLPSAFSQEVISSPNSWNNLDWPGLYKMAEQIMKSGGRKASVLLNLSNLTGAPVHHLLFAANALNFIPRKVGGKKGESDQASDLDELYRILLARKKDNGQSCISVLSEINALIRFLNWLPLLECEDNFNGNNWHYASVCDTSEQLLATLVEHPEVWQDNFGIVFKNQLLPQLADLDAASAKGRFLLQLIVDEKKLAPEFDISINSSWQDKTIQAIFNQRGDDMRPVKNIYPLGLVGNKPLGLALISQSLGEQFINDGFSLSTSQIESYLKENDLIWQKILRLDSEENVPVKIFLAEEIRKLLLKHPLPVWLCSIIGRALEEMPEAGSFAIRSSSLDEGEARGVYATILRVKRPEVENQVRQCIASYYSNSAVSFRATDDASDLPFFAVLIQPFINANGGVDTCLITRNKRRYRHTFGQSAEKITSGTKISKNFTGSFTKRLPRTSRIPITWRILEKLTDFFGSMQIEYSYNGRLVLHQMEFMSVDKKIKSESVPATDFLDINKPEEISTIADKLGSDSNAYLSLGIGDGLNLNIFQGDLLSLIAHFGNRIVEIRPKREISHTSHFANICAHYQIRIIRG